MAAVPFVVLLNYRTQTGKKVSLRCTATDVVAANLLPPTGAQNIQLPTSEGVVTVTDMIYNTGGTDFC